MILETKRTQNRLDKLEDKNYFTNPIDTSDLYQHTIILFLPRLLERKAKFA